MRKIISILMALGVILGLTLGAVPATGAACTATVSISPATACEGATSTYTIGFTSPVTLLVGDLLSVTFGTGTTFGTFAAGDIKVNSNDVDVTKVVKDGTKLTFPVPVQIDAGIAVTVIIAKVVNPDEGSYTLSLDHARDCCPIVVGFNCATYKINPLCSTYELVVDFDSTYPGIAEDFVPPFKACGQNDTDQAFNTTPFFALGVKGAGTAEWSMAQKHSGSYSVHLDTGATTIGDEGRIVIYPPGVTTLGDLDTLSWWVYPVAGYPPHVDIYLDCDGDGVVDPEDVLTAEINENSPCAGWTFASPSLGQQYAAGYGAWWQTFDFTCTNPAAGVPDTEVNDSTVLWVTKMGGGSGDAPSSTLANWKLGIVDSNLGGDPDLTGVITAACKVVRLEIEVDNWVSWNDGYGGQNSEAYIDDVSINGVTYDEPFWFDQFDLIFRTDELGCGDCCDAVNATLTMHLTEAVAGSTVTIAINGTYYNPVKCTVYDVANVTLSANMTVTWPSLLHFDKVSAPGVYTICFNVTCPAGEKTCPECVAGPKTLAHECYDFKVHQWKDAAKMVLDEKWNLISLPLVPFDTDIDVLLESLDAEALDGDTVADLISIWNYDRCLDVADELRWSMYPDPLGLTNLVDGKSYWVRMSYPMTGSYNWWVWGTARAMPPAAPSAYAMCPGWNMFGFTSLIDMASDAYLWNFGGGAPELPYPLVYGWDNTGDWTTSGWLLVNPTVPNMMFHGQGYWGYFPTGGTVVPP